MILKTPGYNLEELGSSLRKYIQISDSPFSFYSGISHLSSSARNVLTPLLISASKPIALASWYLNRRAHDPGAGDSQSLSSSDREQPANQ